MKIQRWLLNLVTLVVVLGFYAILLQPNFFWSRYLDELIEPTDELVFQDWKLRDVPTSGSIDDIFEQQMELSLRIVSEMNAPTPRGVLLRTEKAQPLLGENDPLMSFGTWINWFWDLGTIPSLIKILAIVGFQAVALFLLIQLLGLHVRKSWWNYAYILELSDDRRTHTSDGRDLQAFKYAWKLIGGLLILGGVDCGIRFLDSTLQNWLLSEQFSGWPVMLGLSLVGLVRWGLQLLTAFLGLVLLLKGLGFVALHHYLWVPLFQSFRTGDWPAISVIPLVILLGVYLILIVRAAREKTGYPFVS